MIAVDDAARLEFIGIVIGAVLFIGIAWEIFRQRH